MDFLCLLAVVREVREGLLGRRVAAAAVAGPVLALRFTGGPSLLLDLTPGRPVLALTPRAEGSSREPLARALANVGLAVLLFDYRGYGGNPGSPSETGLAADARAARTYLERRGDVDPSRIVYFGESLGTGVAVALALERPPAALILRSPYTSMSKLGHHHYPFLPVSLLLSDRYPSVERIGRITCPVLVIAGERDSIVPPEQSQRLFNAAPEPKRLVVIPGADHNDYSLLVGELLIEEVVRFLAAVGGDGLGR